MNVSRTFERGGHSLREKYKFEFQRNEIDTHHELRWFSKTVERILNMKSPTLFGYTSKEKKNGFCALLFVCLSLSKPALFFFVFCFFYLFFFFVRALSGKMYTFLLSALSRKMSSFYCSYPHRQRRVRLVVDVQRQARHAQTASCSETSRSTHHCSSRSILPAILHPL